MSECDKYNVAAIVYNLARCVFVLGYRLRPCLMRGKLSARIVELAFINAKVFDVVALEVVHVLSLLLVYDLSITPLHVIAPDNLEKVFSCFFRFTLDIKIALSYYYY